jgi:hypothetical protein
MVLLNHLIMIESLVCAFRRNANELLDVSIFLNASLSRLDFFDASLRGSLFLTLMIDGILMGLFIFIILVRGGLSIGKLIEILIIRHFFELDDLILLSYK